MPILNSANICIDLTNEETNRCFASCKNRLSQNYRGGNPRTRLPHFFPRIKLSCSVYISTCLPFSRKRRAKRNRSGIDGYSSCSRHNSLFPVVGRSRDSDISVRDIPVVGIQFTVHGFQFTVYGSQFTVYSLQFTVYSLQFTVYSLQFTVYSLQFTVYSLQFTVCSLQFTERWQALDGDSAANTSRPSVLPSARFSCSWTRTIDPYGPNRDLATYRNPNEERGIREKRFEHEEHLGTRSFTVSINSSLPFSFSSALLLFLPLTEK